MSLGQAVDPSSARAPAQPGPREELRCKDCRYWYGADTDGLSAVLSAPYVLRGVLA